MLRIDAGSRHIGLSVTTESKEHYSADIEVRTDLQTCSLRGVSPDGADAAAGRVQGARFDKRTHAKHMGWLSLSVEQKISTHISAVGRSRKSFL